MKIGIDSYCYHRLFGEVYDMQETPEKYKTVDDLLELGIRLGVDGISLETCFLPSLDDGYLKELGAKLKEYGFDTVFAWGHPNGLERGLNPDAFEEMKRLIPKTTLLGTDVMRITGSAFDWRHENHRDHIERLVPMYKEATKIAEDCGVRHHRERRHSAGERSDLVVARGHAFLDGRADHGFKWVGTVERVEPNQIRTGRKHHRACSDN